MKKALIVSTVSRQFTLFETGNIKVLNELGYEVHCAANYSDVNDELDKLDIIRHHIDIERSPFKINQIKAYRQLSELMKKEKFDLVHCHAPMGGVIGRLAAKRNKIPKVIYTAHGFHFYKGAPLLNNIIYKNIEKIIANYTDILITMNEEDYLAAKSFKLKENGTIAKIPGVGIDLVSIDNCIKENKIRSKFNINLDDIVILSVGELIERKNHIDGIKTLKRLIEKTQGNKNFYYLICGKGKLEKNLKKYCKKIGIEKNVIFLGYRNDVYEIMKESDIFLFPSLQEGLPKSAMEAMACGMPLVLSNIRGNVDLVSNSVNGYTFINGDIDSITKCIENAYKNREVIKVNNLNKSKEYSIDKVNCIMKKLYND